MTRRHLRPILANLALVALITSCAKDDTPVAVAPESPSRPAAASGETTAPAPATAVLQAADSADPAALQAGIEVMRPRASNAVTAYGKIEVTPSFRYFMHPMLEKDASIEFDTTGLASISLSPYVGNLEPSADCAPSNAGVVKFSYALDGAEPVNMVVDRTFNRVVGITVRNARKLRLNVNHGNDDVTCDWFSVGFVEVVKK